MLFLIQLKTLWAAFTAMALCWLRFDLMSTRTSSAFPAKLPCSLLPCSTHRCTGLFLPRCSTFYLTLLSFMRFLFACVSTRCITDISATPHSFVSSLNLLPSSWISFPSSWTLWNLLASICSCSLGDLQTPQGSCKEGAHPLLSQPQWKSPDTPTASDLHLLLAPPSEPE